ncbi:WSC domain-containing protein [Crucibulum laeve]|uniref:WSC domain-containing protein n=1 Tax=Crucibulum laeve TaxID=68775 RepID=A0A5C3LG14_9AGAR|nr:WSC domain-containing protein [Crucibulum laeve]
MGPHAILSFFLSIAIMARAIPSGLETRQLSLPAGWSSLGCYTDSTSSRTLATASFTSVDGMTITSCVNFCNSGGYRFAGMEFGRECYCDNSIRSPGAIASANDCNMPCTGDASSVCGAADRLSVYASSATSTSTTATTTQSPTPRPTIGTGGGYSYQGCFVDPVNPDRALLHQVGVPGGVTALRCANACQAAGFNVAGVEFGTECWCDNYMPFDFLTPNIINSDCNMPCAGDPTQACGAANRIQLYGGPRSDVPDRSTCMSGGRDSSKYRPFILRAITRQQDQINLAALPISTDSSGQTTFILTDPTTQGFPGTASFSGFTLDHNTLISNVISGNPVTLTPVTGESLFFVNNTNEAPSAGYCAAPLDTDNLIWYGFPALALDGSPAGWALCHNSSANNRFDIVYRPVDNHSNYDKSSCLQDVSLQMFVPH